MTAVLGDLTWLGSLALVLAVAGGYLLEVQLPWRARVPLGHALVIALAQMLVPASTAAVVAGGLVAALPVLLTRYGATAAVRLVAAAATGAVAAVTALAMIRTADFSSLDRDVAVFVEIVVAGIAYLGIDFLVGATRVTRAALRERLPLSVVLICAAALLAIAHEHYGGLIAPLAATLPLLVIRFSFERYARARETYEQTAEALGLLPEVAGHTPIGHGARTAVYASWLAEELRLEPHQVARVATAARVHHIGYVSVHDAAARAEPVNPAALARASGDILRETGFLADVAPIVEAVQHEATATIDTATAIVRVASTLDDLVGAGGDDAPRLLVAAVVERHPSGKERQVALALLRNEPEVGQLVRLARAQSAGLVVAAAAEHTHH